jgi:hypothetical protein
MDEAELEFDWGDQGLDVSVPELDLSNMERHQLRALAGPGLPLGKLRQFFIDSGNVYRQHMANIDLGEEGGLKAAREAQIKIQACQWVLDTLQAALTLQKENEESAL